MQDLRLTFSAWTVTVLDLAEAVYAIYVFVAIGWRRSPLAVLPLVLRNASVAGFILKWGLLMMCIFFGSSPKVDSSRPLSLGAMIPATLVAMNLLRI